MDKAQLTLTLESLQMMALLVPLHSRAEHQLIHSRFLAKIHNSAAYLVLAGQTSPVDPAAQQPHTDFLAECHLYLKQSLAKLKVETLVKAVLSNEPGYRVAALLEAKDKSWLETTFSAKLAALTSQAPTIAATRKLPLATNPRRTDRMGQVIHNLRSVMRNTSWLPLLVQFKSTGDAQKLSAALHGHFATPQGRSLRESREALLLTTPPTVKPTTTTKPLTKAALKKAVAVLDLSEDAFTCTVALNMPATVAHPLVRDVVNLSLDAPDGPAALAQILEKAGAARPVASNTTPKQVAEQAFAELLGELSAVRDTMLKATEKQKQLKEKQQKEKALEALRALGPLLAVVKSNPELLANA